jgi:hypothetical protein
MTSKWISSLVAVVSLVWFAAGCPGSRQMKVTTTPPGAAVVINDQPVGVTPVQMAFPAGNQPARIRIVYQGYRSWEGTLTASQAAQQFSQPVVLEKLKEPKIIFTSVPSGAEVVVDGERLGATPFTLPSMKPGTTCEVLFVREGYMKEQRTLTVDGLVPEITVAVTMKSSVELYYKRKITEEPQNYANHTDLLHYYMMEKRFDDAVAIMRCGMVDSSKKPGVGSDRFWQEVDKIWGHQYVYGTHKEIESVRAKIVAMLQKVIAEDANIGGQVKQRYQMYNTQIERK